MLKLGSETISKLYVGDEPVIAAFAGIDAVFVDDFLTILGSKLLAFYDPSDVTTLFQDSAGTTPVVAATDPVGMMQDKTDNDYHIIQATAGARPLWDGVGGLTYDGTDDFLAGTGQPFPSGSDPVEIWASVEQDDPASSAVNRSIFCYGGVTSPLHRNLQKFVSGGVNRFRGQIGDGSGSFTALVPDVDFSGSHIVRLQINPTTLIATADDSIITGNGIPATGTSRFRMGATTGNTPAGFWLGKIKKTVVTLPLTMSEAAIVKHILSS